MKKLSERSAKWLYRGLWRGLADWFRVPAGPPVLPVEAREGLRIFHPSPRYLVYMKLFFWVFFVLSDVAIAAVWIAIYLVFPLAGWLLLLPALLVAIVPDIIAYVAIHLRYDTIWYGLSDRGLYIRRGIVVISEHAITLDNIQNISLRRGPLEQLLGLSTVVVETAATSGQHEGTATSSQSVMVGLGDAKTVQEVLTQRIRTNRGVGLGDDQIIRRANSEDVQLLKEILAEVRTKSDRATKS